MGAVAARYADRVYVTNDNPRTEDPNAIVEQIVAGIAGCEYVVELDRRAAIERAVAQARPGDAVLVAGKGHETYQIVGRDAVEFDDAVGRPAGAAAAHGRKVRLPLGRPSRRPTQRCSTRRALRTKIRASTDTRTLREGDAFVALRGERFDGHDYISEAVRRGAALVDRRPARAARRRASQRWSSPIRRRAYMALATLARRRFEGCVLGDHRQRRQDDHQGVRRHPSDGAIRDAGARRACQ